MMPRFHNVQSLVKDKDGNFPPLEIVDFTPEEEAAADAILPPTAAEKDARSASEAASRMTDPLVVVLARAAGVPLAQLETDLAAEIRLGL